jgi:hypothetical protein
MAMNKYEYLRASLMNGVGEPSTERDLRLHKWARTHDPLLSPSVYTTTGRHLNHFCIGSDPEFCFVNPNTGDRYEARQCGLYVGLAAGCDQNERLVELRPWPSVSVVEHVAGILTALRWMYRVYNRTVGVLNWRAGGYYAGDGIGGHVHFGRKRPTRTQEIAALDGLARVFKLAGLFPINEWLARMRGDRLGQRYGVPGDFRIQKHGYEYRSLPSWLQSPTVAFIVLTASKLAVLDPEITNSWNDMKVIPEADVPTARNALRGLAKLYKGRDDDARILYHLLTFMGDQVFRIEYGRHFAPAWGIPQGAVADDTETTVILPSTIKPVPEEIVEMRDHLLLGSPLTFKQHAATFTTALPRNAGFRWLPREVQVGRLSGYGDLIHNLVAHTKMPLRWEYNNHGEFRVVGPLVALWTGNDIDFLKSYYPSVRIQATGEGTSTLVMVPKPLCQTPTISGFKAVLLHSGLFPLWTVETVQRNSFEQWLAARPKPSKPASWRNL